MAKDTERQSEKVAPRYSDPFGALRSEMEPCDQREKACGSKYLADQRGRLS